MRYATARWYASESAAHARALAAPYSHSFRQHLTKPTTARVYSDGRIVESQASQRRNTETKPDENLS